MDKGHVTRFAVILTAFVTILKRHHVALSPDAMTALVTVFSDSIPSDKAERLELFMRGLDLDHKDLLAILASVESEALPEYIESGIRALL